MDKDAFTEIYKKLLFDKINTETCNGWQAANPHPVPAKKPKSNMKKKLGRPKKSDSVASGHKIMSLEVLANGYMITVGSGGAPNTYVFSNLDDANKWMKDNLHPKYKHAEFMEAL